MEKIDVKNESINLTDKELQFTGTSEGKEYSVNVEFFKNVDAAGSTYKVLPRSVQMHIMKGKDDRDEFWPRLLNDKALEKNQVKIDWDRYVDEDEENEGFDMSALEGGMGMGGMGGPGGMDMEALMKQMGNMGGDGMEMPDDEDDSGDENGDDQEDLPDLEEVEQ
jgi:hypothetical protein